MGISAYSTTPASNTAISGINLAEGCNASGINDAIRQMMADIASALSGGQFFPTASIVSYAGSGVPTGFLPCDGAAVSRATYAALFVLVGTNFGVGDGSTTFNVPDLRGRTIIGAGTGSGLTARALYALGGEESHVLTVGETPSLSVTGTTDSQGGHGHTITITDPGHIHSYFYPSVTSGSPFTIGSNNLASKMVDSTLATSSNTCGITASSSSDGAHTHTVTGTTSGGGGAHNNMQPFQALNYAIKT